MKGKIMNVRRITKWLGAVLALAMVFTLMPMGSRTVKADDAITTVTGTVAKGNTITLTTNGVSYQYLVLKVDTTNEEALVVMKTNKSVSWTNWFNSRDSGRHYNSSALQNNMTNQLYANAESELGVAKSDIKAKTITVGEYQIKPGSPSDAYVAKGTSTYYSSKPELYGSTGSAYYVAKRSETTISDQYVYPLDVQDVADYIGKDNLSNASISNMFGTVSGGGR